jgi:hypothetical protein
MTTGMNMYDELWWDLELRGIAGTKVYIDSNGNLVGSRPSMGPGRYVAVVAVQGPTGLVIVQTKGNGTWGALKDGLS